MSQAPRPPADAQALYDRVRQAAAESPYVVTPTEKGFDLKVDIVNAKWWGALNRAELKKSFIHHVAVTDPRTYLITDDYVDIEWSGGVPSAHYSKEREVGRVYKKSFEVAYGFNENHRLEKIYSYTFDSEESRRLVKDAAKALGMKEKTPTTVRIGLAVGLGTIVALIIAGLVLLLLHLL